MLPNLHQHILSDLDRSTKADTVFVFGAVLLDLVSIGVNSGLAYSTSPPALTIFWIFMFGVLMVSVIAASALHNGTKGCLALQGALLAIYAREGLEHLYPKAAMRTGMTRYYLYFTLIAALGLLAVAVPLIVLLMPKL